MLEMRDSVAVITGGGQGIGRALAEYWVTNGGKVVLGDISEPALEETKSELEKLGGQVVTCVCNVVNEDDCGRLADLAIEVFGKINLVAPFAGITKDGLLLTMDRDSGKVTGKMSLDQFQKVIDINLTGVFLTVREAAERMVNHNCRGLICLISSVGSLGTAGQMNYSSTKAAMSVMPKVITAEFFRRGIADRIRCVAVAPGYVGTPMVLGMNDKVLQKIMEQIPIGRLIDPYEIASLIGELYRNEALAGEVFFVTGGLRLGSRG
ncbi:MAG: SDR family NAD(P)-dependent oxidoreductase [Syntrophobacteraceae bacterium]